VLFSVLASNRFDDDDALQFGLFLLRQIVLWPLLVNREENERHIVSAEVINHSHGAALTFRSAGPAKLSPPTGIWDQISLFRVHAE
jgi:hypothetical protein